MLVAVAAEPESATEASDAELAGRVREGDRAAEAELFRRLAPRVRLYGLRHLRDPAAADDLVQDVLLMTFDSLRAGKVREDERLASFVLGTCRRMAKRVSVSRSSVASFRRERGEDLEQPPDIDRSRLPDCLWIDDVVMMDELVAHPGDGLPRNSSRKILEFRGQPLRRLANHE